MLGKVPAFASLWLHTVGLATVPFALEGSVKCSSQWKYVAEPLRHVFIRDSAGNLLSLLFEG